MDGLNPGPARRRGLSPQVYLIGLGIPEIRAVSREALEAMEACKTLFVNDPGNAFFRQLCPDARPIDNLGVGWSRRKMEAFLGKVLRAAREKGSAGLAVYGHPMIYEPLGHFLLRACRRRRIPCTVIGGLSSFDAVFSALKQSLYGGVGVQVSSPDHFLGLTPDPASYVLVLQAGVGKNILAMVVSHCLRHYPRAHRVALVRAENWSPESVRWLSLSTLSRRPPGEDLYATLVIPPRRPVPQVSRRIVRAKRG